MHHHSLRIALGLGGCLSWHVAASAAAGFETGRGLLGASCNSRWPMPTPAGPNAEVKAPKPAPQPTTGPTADELRLELVKRQADENICGYEQGDPSKPFGCGTAARCIFNAGVSAAWCCANTVALTDCYPLTTCLDSTAWKTYTTTVPAGTGYCSKADYPKCVQFIYGDAPYSGFTFQQCGTAYTREVAFQSATSTTSTSSKSTSSPSTTTTPPPVPATPTPSPTDTGGGSGSSSTNTGAIVGGVVGGVAVLGLIGLALFMILRKRSKHPHEDAPVQQQQMTQQYYPPSNAPPAGFPQGTPPPVVGGGGGMVSGSPPLDQRGSMFKPPYESSSVLGSPPASPLQPGQEYANTSAGLGFQHQTPPSWSPQPQSPTQPAYPPHYNVPPINNHNHAELPTERGDGQLTELQG